MDFSCVPTATFRVLQVLFIVRHGRRQVVRCAVTTSPAAARVAQHLREVFPFDSVPRFMIFDRGAIFSAGVMAMLLSMRIESTRTSVWSPWQNGVAERFVATVRRELLDHVIVRNEHRLGTSKDSPLGRPDEGRPAGTTSNVGGLPRVGGLHHR